MSAQEEADVDAAVISHVLRGYAGGASLFSSSMPLAPFDGSWMAGTSVLHYLEEAAVSGRTACLVCLDTILFADKVMPRIP